MILTVLAVLLLVAVLAKYLMNIIHVLNDIGGNGRSLLARLRVGLRAIESETGYLPEQATKLNQTLSHTAEQMEKVHRRLDDTVTAVSKQERGKA